MIALRRQDSATNCARFYRIDIGPDLFGTWCVTRSWGRIGTQGRQGIVSHPDAASARAAAARLAAAKERRGYRAA